MIIQLLTLSIFFSPSWGLAGDCIQAQLFDTVQDPYPKPGVLCSSPEPENIWRGELIFEYLEDSSGIRVKWKHIVQKADCWGVAVKFYVNNRELKRASIAEHENIDWVEIREEKTFQLKIKALYNLLKTEPKCLEASRTINMNHFINFFTEDDYKNTIIVSLSGLLLITIIVFTVIAIVVWRRIREGIMKVDNNRDVYGTYYGGEVEYSEVQDSNPYYGS